MKDFNILVSSHHKWYWNQRTSNWINFHILHFENSCILKYQVWILKKQNKIDFNGLIFIIHLKNQKLDTKKFQNVLNRCRFQCRQNELSTCQNADIYLQIQMVASKSFKSSLFDIYSIKLSRNLQNVGVSLAQTISLFKIRTSPFNSLWHTQLTR